MKESLAKYFQLQRHTNTADTNLFFVRYELSVIELRTRLHMKNMLYS